MATKKYIEFINEISSDLLKRASDKARSHGQKKLSNKFLNHESGKKKHIYNNSLDMKMLGSYEFDYFLKYYNLDSDDIPFGDSGGVTKMVINDFDFMYNEIFWIFMGFPELDVVDDMMILSKFELYLDGDDLVIDQQYNGNKFANRKSAMKFIEMLKKLYIIHNPNIVNNALAKMNNTEVSNEVGSGFYLCVNSKF